MCSPPLVTLWKGPTPARIMWVTPRTTAKVTRNANEARNSLSRRSFAKWNVYSLLSVATLPGKRFASPRAARDLVLEDRKIGSRQSVDVTLERERPVLGRPLPHVVEAVRELLRRHPVNLLEHDVRPDVDAPRVILVAPRRAPDRRVVFVHRRRDRDGGGERHPPGDVVKDAVADPHRLDPPPVTALQSLDGESVLARLAEVVRRADDHPVLGRTAAARARLALASRPPAPGGTFSLRRGLHWWLELVRHDRNCLTKGRPDGPGPGLPAPAAGP